MINRLFMSVLMLSIAGGFISSVFIATEKKIYKYTSANFVVVVNTITIFCFVIPFFKILSFADYSSVMLREFDLIVWAEPGTTKHLLYSTMKDIKFADNITNIWFAGVIIYIFYEVMSYIFFLFFVRKTCEPLDHSVWTSVFKQICSKSFYNIDAVLYTSDTIKQPCVIGVKSSMIVIPYYLLDILKADEIEVILRHELTHVKKRDVFFKMFISILNSLHWFNPLFYALKENLEEWTEISCDESVVACMDSEQKKLYANVLIKLNEEHCKRQRQRAVLYFGNKNMHILKRRILGIMKKSSLGNKFSKVVVFTLMVGTISGGSVIAKASDYAINSMFSNHVAVLDENAYFVKETNDSIVSELGFIDFDEESFKGEKLSVENLENSNITYKIISEDGTRTDFTENEVSTKHQHNYKKVNIESHEKYSDGSCKTSIYEGRQCTECGKTSKGDLINELTYKKCPH